jgi:mRNA interferase RelE/StbE
MSYSLEFKVSALKEWRKLAQPIREQFKEKLAERLEYPRIPASRLHGLPDCYKIKLRASGYRLVYQVDDHAITVVVIAVGRRDRIYRITDQRV